MAASVVDLPEPVAPTTITMPRLAIASSLITEGMFSSSVVGMWSEIVRKTMPTLPCCTNADTRKRPMPVGLMAKLHSFDFSNSAAWRSFMIERTSSAVCCAVSGWFDTGSTRPSILNAGGKSDVRNRSEPFLLISRRRRSCTNRVAWSLSMVCLRCFRSTAERVRRLGVLTRLAQRDDVAPHEVEQVLVEGLHPELAARLDHRVHLR